MKPILLLFFISLVACCPKITSTETITVKTDTFIDTVFVDVPVIIAPAESQVIDIDLKSLCDSLYKGQLKPQTRTSESKRNDGTRQLIARTEIDSMLHLIVSCKEEAYRDTLDSVRTENMVLRTQINTDTKTVVKERWYETPWFYIAMIFLLINLLQLKFRK